MLSLRWKLVGLYALILCLVVGGFSAALVAAMRRSQLRALDEELDARARALVGRVEHEGGRWFVEEKTGVNQEFAEDRGVYYVIEHQGAEVLSSALARRLGARIAAADGDREVEFGGRRFHERVSTLAKLADEEEGGQTEQVRVAVAKDIAPMEQSLDSLVGQLAVVGPAVLVLSLAGGLFLVSRALRPIDRMTTAAGEIQATDLSKRLDVRGGDEIARLAKTLNDLFRRLEASFERQARFTADASHELRTPLALVAGNVELALKRPRTAEEYKDAIAEIGEAADRMRSVVEGLLTLARADAKSVPLKRETVRLSLLALDVARLHRPLAEKAQVEVIVEPLDEARVTGDPDRLKELVSNLLTNAIRYNKPGGKVTVRASSSAGVTQLVVEDTGIGIPAEDLGHVFERFYRVDKARSREIGGSGLGLAIAKWIVDAHLGTISVSSDSGVGTRLTVCLPEGSVAVACS
ncbi:MAG: ATP-binding protein [Planctomycetota bacterium]